MDGFLELTLEVFPTLLNETFGLVYEDDLFKVGIVKKCFLL